MLLLVLSYDILSNLVEIGGMKALGLVALGWNGSVAHRVKSSHEFYLQLIAVKQQRSVLRFV